MQFCFIHAADLHIDSPLAGLGAREPAVAARFAKAGRRAVENLIDRTLAEKAAFLVIAGDIFDGDWKDYSSGLFFARELGRLHRAGIPTFIVKGNHDADSIMSKSLPYAPSVTTFESARAGTALIERLGVALHGRSFGSRHVPADFHATYPAARPGLLNIGVLHTSLDGSRGHDAYATCSADDLAAFGYDYWALGHVHAAAQVSTTHPRIVFPGNIQGRSVRETGPKGAVRVNVENGRIIDVTPLVLDAARWELAAVGLDGCCDLQDLHGRIETEIAAAHAAADGRPLALRLALHGVTPLQARIVATRETLLADARAMALAVADDCWIEQLQVSSSAPPLPAVAAPDGLDIGHLLELTAHVTTFDAEIEKLMRTIADKLPRELRTVFMEDGEQPRARIRAMARDHLAGALGHDAALVR